MKRTGVRQAGGRVAATAFSMSSRRRNNPGSAGTSLSLSSAHQAGWVKSPVATTPMPLRAAQWARCSRSRSRLVAREYFEWTCRSAWKRMDARLSLEAANRRGCSSLGCQSRGESRPVDGRVLDGAQRTGQAANFALILPGLGAGAHFTMALRTDRAPKVGVL